VEEQKIVKHVLKRQDVAKKSKKEGANKKAAKKKQ